MGELVVEDAIARAQGAPAGWTFVLHGFCDDSDSNRHCVGLNQVVWSKLVVSTARMRISDVLRAQVDRHA